MGAAGGRLMHMRAAAGNRLFVTTRAGRLAESVWKAGEAGGAAPSLALASSAPASANGIPRLPSLANPQKKTALPASTPWCSGDDAAVKGGTRRWVKVHHQAREGSPLAPSTRGPVCLSWPLSLLDPTQLCVANMALLAAAVRLARHLFVPQPFRCVSSSLFPCRVSFCSSFASSLCLLLFPIPSPLPLSTTLRQDGPLSSIYY